MFPASVQASGAELGYKIKSGALSITALTLEPGALIEILTLLSGAPEFGGKPH